MWVVRLNLKTLSILDHLFPFMDYIMTGFSLFINNKWEFQWLPESGSFILCNQFELELGNPQSGSFFHVELDFGNVGFVEGGKPEYREKNPRSRDENQQQTQPTYGPYWCEASASAPSPRLLFHASDVLRSQY